MTQLHLALSPRHFECALNDAWIAKLIRQLEGFIAEAVRVAKAITTALESIDSTTRILVENTAGAGKTIGRTAAEVASILHNVPDRLRHRTGYGLDTCHLFASGYDLRISP